MRPQGCAAVPACCHAAITPIKAPSLTTKIMPLPDYPCKQHTAVGLQQDLQTRPNAVIVQAIDYKSRRDGVLQLLQTMAMIESIWSSEQLAAALTNPPSELQPLDPADPQVRRPHDNFCLLGFQIPHPHMPATAHDQAVCLS